MSISFEVFAKDTVYNCDNDNFRDYASQRWMKQTLKVEDPLFGERKLFIRKEGFGNNYVLRKKTLLLMIVSNVLNQPLLKIPVTQN